MYSRTFTFALCWAAIFMALSLYVKGDELIKGCQLLSLFSVPILLAGMPHRSKMAAEEVYDDLEEDDEEPYTYYHSEVASLILFGWDREISTPGSMVITQRQRQEDFEELFNFAKNQCLHRNLVIYDIVGMQEIWVKEDGVVKTLPIER